MFSEGRIHLPRHRRGAGYPQFPRVEAAWELVSPGCFPKAGGKGSFCGSSTPLPRAGAPSGHLYPSPKWDPHQDEHLALWLCAPLGGCRSEASLSSPAGIAPNITRGPLDSTVIDGMSVVLACETSGAPRPAITWQKGR